jgi:hypothetical protein
VSALAAGSVPGTPALPLGDALLGHHSDSLPLRSCLLLAEATGMIPDDVQQALRLAAAHRPDASLTPEIDHAVERTSAATADGGTLEVWTAPTTGGGACAYLRRLDAAGAPTDSGPISVR